MRFRTDWNAFIESLLHRGVRFVIVGAHALAAHGRPRYTEDLDILVEPTQANARRLGAALADFGFAAAAKRWRTMTRPYQILVLGNVSRIDVLSSISGVSFRDAWKHRMIVKTDLGDLPVLGLAQLQANKAAAGRAKDLADLALLAELITPAAGRSRSTRRPRAAPPSRTPGKVARRRPSRA